MGAMANSTVPRAHIGTSSKEDPHSLIDRIYEAALVSELWPQVLEELSSLVGSAGTVLGIRRSDGWGSWVASGSLVEPMTLFFGSDLQLRTEVTSRLLAARHPGFVSELDVFRPEEIASDPFFAELMMPRGMGPVLATAIQIPTGDLAIFHVQRYLSQGGFDQHSVRCLDGLRPHLARAAMLATRLRLERFRASAEALAAIGLPAAILGPSGKVLAANGLIQQLDEIVNWAANDNLTLRDRRGQDMLWPRLQQSRDDRTENGAVSFPIAGTAGACIAVGHLIPTRRQARDLFDGSTFIFVVSPIEKGNGADVALIQSLFDLTPAEARVATGISAGRTVAQLAIDHRVSFETIRSQLKRIMAKTGVHRQVDLVNQLRGLSSCSVRFK